MAVPRGWRAPTAGPEQWQRHGPVSAGGDPAPRGAVSRVRGSWNQPSVTVAGSRVRERLAGLGNEVPVVMAGAQRELQDAERLVVAPLAAGDRRGRAGAVLAAGPDDELAHAPDRVDRAGGVQRREALVGVLVRGEDEVGAAVVEVVPDRR